MAFTLIWFDNQGRAVLSLNERKEYVARLPSTTGTYMGSHLVLVTGLINTDGEVTALEVLDPAAATAAGGFRIVTKEFFLAHGKTVHAIEKNCASIL